MSKSPNQNPAHVRIQRLTTQNVAAGQDLIRMFREVFAWENSVTVSDTYLADLLARPDFVAFAVLDGTQVIGGLTGYELPRYDLEGIEFFIYDVAVVPQYRRQGWGKKLLAQTIAHCRAQGIDSCFVDASVEDQHAVDFYRDFGGRPEQVVQFDLM